MTTTTGHATTTTTTPEFSFDDSVPPPKLLNTGTNYPAIAESLEIYGNWLSAHRPDPALARRILAPGTQLLRLFSRDLTLLRDNDKRLVEHLRAPGEYSVVSASSDAFSVRAREHIRTHETVDTHGNVSSQAAFPLTSTFRFLGVLSQGHWYLAATDPEQPAVNVDK